MCNSISFFAFGRKTLMMVGVVLFLAASGFVAGSVNAQQGRTVRSSTIALPQSPETRQIVVSYVLDSQGDENVVGFTATFNPTFFTYVSAELGALVPVGHQLTLNTTQVAQGRLGVIIGPGNSGLFATGPRQLLRVTLTVAPNTPAGVYPVGFTGTPIQQGTSGLNGVILATNYVVGNIVIGPSAAGVTISGRVLTANGQGLRNATVVITDAEGNRRTAVTSSFGFYSFEDIESGKSYVVNASSRRYKFAARILNVDDSLANVDFTGQE